MTEDQTKPTSKTVVFTLPQGTKAQSASVVGDFNGWNPQTHPMRQNAEGLWQASAELEAGREYQFRYLVNGLDWHNDPRCACCPNPYGGENSLLHT
ncbi:MAG: isoamylase early set domain-containing protein [Meiothermus sp.]|nr:isoamylase early set domain-containing protein [Meiothermus sp.]